MIYFFGFYGPKIRGGGSSYPSLVQKYEKTLKFGLFLGIFACSGLVVQNSAAHQCTCQKRTFARNSPFLWILCPQNRDWGVLPNGAFSQTIKNPGIRPFCRKSSYL